MKYFKTILKVVPWGLLTFWLFVLSFCLLSCKGLQSGEYVPVGTEKFDVIRVFINEPNEFLVLQNENQLINRKLLRGETTVLADVPPESPMWIQVTRFHETEGGWLSHQRDDIFKYEIHIHNPQDIEGGAWHKSTGGKFPTRTKGQVQVVE